MTFRNDQPRRARCGPIFWPTGRAYRPENVIGWRATSSGKELFYARILSRIIGSLDTRTRHPNEAGTSFHRVKNLMQGKRAIGLIVILEATNQPVASRSRATASNTRKVRATPRAPSLARSRRISHPQDHKGFDASSHGAENILPADGFNWALHATFWQTLWRRWILVRNVTWSESSEIMGLVFLTALSSPEYKVICLT